MTTLHLTLDDGEHKLADDTPHYLWLTGERLHVTAQPPPPSATAQLGYLSPMLDSWWFHHEPADSLGTLWLDGQPVTTGHLQLPRPRAQISFSDDATDDSPPADDDIPPAHDVPDDDAPNDSADQAPACGASWVIGPVGTHADITID